MWFIDTPVNDFEDSLSKKELKKALNNLCG